jgi:ABC-type uncharacterized transport system auxiliary subunit
MGCSACFGSVNEPLRHYYTLHLAPLPPLAVSPVSGLLRVRDLDAESIYDRFAFVVRKSPYELSFRSRELWAVKPNQMISDMVARGLSEQGAFTGISRELSERRPDFLMTGELHAIEIYEVDGEWLAHIHFSLQITHFESGKVLWTFTADKRKPFAHDDYAAGVRALSELISLATQDALLSLQHLSKSSPPWSIP